MRIVDASNNNGAVNWQALKGHGIKAAYLKVSEGTKFIDTWYGRNTYGARAIGMKVGGYHFGHPANDPIEEARHFLSLLRLRPGDLLPALDIESTDGKTAAEIEAWSAKFLSFVEAKIGAKPAIYSGDYFARLNLGKLVERHPFWVASYGVKPHRPYAAWQFTDRDEFHLDESFAVSLVPLTYKPHLLRKVAHKVAVPKARRWWMEMHIMRHAAR